MRWQHVWQCVLGTLKTSRNWLLRKTVKKKKKKKKNSRTKIRYQFSVVALKSSHKLSGLKEYECIIWQLCRSEIQHKFCWAKIKVLARRNSFRNYHLEQGDALGKNLLLSRLPQLLKAAYISWLAAPVCRLQIQQRGLPLTLIPLSHLFFFFWPQLGKVLFFQRSVWLDWAHPENLPISRFLTESCLQSHTFSPCSHTFRASRVRTRASLGQGHCSASDVLVYSSQCSEQCWATNALQQEYV